MKMKRRDFLKSSAGAAATWLAMPAAEAAVPVVGDFGRHPGQEAYQTSLWLYFPKIQALP